MRKTKDTVPVLSRIVGKNSEHVNLMYLFKHNKLNFEKKNPEVTTEF